MCLSLLSLILLSLLPVLILVLIDIPRGLSRISISPGTPPVAYSFGINRHYYYSHYYNYDSACKPGLTAAVDSSRVRTILRIQSTHGCAGDGSSIVPDWAQMGLIETSATSSDSSLIGVFLSNSAPLRGLPEPRSNENVPFRLQVYARSPDLRDALGLFTDTGRTESHERSI